MHKSNPPPAVKQFNQDIYILLKANTAQARALLAFIRRMLWQYNLDTTLVTDVFIEAYVRGVKYLLKSEGEEIRKPSAWMRVTILNVIREKAKENNRLEQLDRDVTEEDVYEAPIDLVDEGCFLAVIQAFNTLDHDDRKIIQLRVLENKRWEEIKEKLDEPNLTTPALRKRGQRALERLRVEYHKIRPPM